MSAANIPHQTLDPKRIHQFIAFQVHDTRRACGTTEDLGITHGHGLQKTKIKHTLLLTF